MQIDLSLGEGKRDKSEGKPSSSRSIPRGENSLWKENPLSDRLTPGRELLTNGRFSPDTTPGEPELACKEKQSESRLDG